MAVISEESAPVNGKTNWLLHGLIGVSFVLHATALLCMPDVFHLRKTSYIELTMREIPCPVAPHEPAPPVQEKKKQQPERMVLRPVREKKPAVRPLPQVLPPAEPVQPLAPKEQPAIASPAAMAAMQELKPPPEHPIGQAVAEAPSTPPSTAETRSANDDEIVRNYLALIRQRIERCKKYPRNARMKQQEGEVTIRFILSAEGEAQQLEIRKSSGREILDQAALAAVRDASPLPRPPPALFSGPASMEINIIFTLSRGRSNV